MSLKQLALAYFPRALVRLLRSEHYKKQLKQYSVSMEPDLLGCKALLKPGDMVLDVGANIGVYTRFCADFVGPKGHVYSLEPIPETYSYLTRNVSALGLENVTCYNYAASDRDEDARMSIPDYTSGGANIYEARLSKDGNISVKTAKLDTLFPSQNPTLIKCDVEGHDLACIEGAKELIARCRPYWIVEVSNDATFELFASLRYDVFVWHEGEFHRASSEDKVPNYFFFPKS